MREVKKENTITDNLVIFKGSNISEPLETCSGLLEYKMTPPCFMEQSKEIISIPISKQSFSVDPNTLKVITEHGSPLVFLIVLCYFFKILTRFVEVCQK